VRTVVRVALALSAGLLLAACAGDGLPQDTLAPEGPIARAQDNLWNLVFIVAVVVFVIVEVLLVAVLVRFRAKPGDTTIPKQTHGNTKLEVLWTVIPALILAVIAVPTVRLIFDLAAAPENALQVTVVGKQYWWEFQYLDDNGEPEVITANELVIPVDRDISLTLTSTGQATTDAGGVIHSFWVPKLAGKQDVIPGHERHLTIRAEESGRSYSGQCAEFCGLSHANMRFAVIAKEPADFEAWLDDHAKPQTTPTSGDAARGAELFTERQCTGCHTINGLDGAGGIVGPNLTYFAQREKFAGYMLENDVKDDADNVKAWLESPPDVKPGSQMPDLGLQPQDIEDLVAYLRTLK
jgi:cytochrome c oxidase subunit 2